MRAHGRRRREQPTPQQRVGQVRTRLLDAAKAVSLGHRRTAETGKLREDVPDPVTALASRLQFAERPVEVALLRAAEAIQVEGHSSENGGYSSTSSSMYASTRIIHRNVPTPKRTASRILVP